VQLLWISDIVKRNTKGAGIAAQDTKSFFAIGQIGHSINIEMPK
jgi:hypothetical protein